MKHDPPTPLQEPATPPVRPSLGALLWSDRILRAVLVIPIVTLGFARAAATGTEVLSGQGVLLAVSVFAGAYAVWRVRIMRGLATGAVLIRARIGVDWRHQGPRHEELRSLHLSFEHKGRRFSVERLVREGEGGAVRSTSDTLLIWFAPHAPRWAALVDQRLLIVRVTPG